jgi:hypothetical protein
MIKKYSKIILITLIALIISAKIFAIDTTGKKRPFITTLTFGYTNNTVYGSMYEKDRELNNRAGIGPIEMTKKGGLAINFRMAKKIDDFIAVKSGISFIYKQVNPQDNTIYIYRDELRTGYLSVPLLAEINTAINMDSQFNFFLEFGSSANFRLFDKSISGPDRNGFKTSFVSFSLLPGAGLSCRLPHGTRLLLQYNYMHDISNAYIESLYWSSAEPNRDFNYKYKTHCFSIGFQW